MNMLLLLLQKMALAAVPAVGFALVFNVPRKALKYCAAFGACGYGLRFLLIEAGIPIEGAAFIAAAAVSLTGVWVAQRLSAHPKVFTVAAMIPLVPGVPLFTALIALVQIHRKGYSTELMATMVSSGLRAAFIISAIAIGLAIPGLLFYRRRPVV
jgi:uncharacterized membrane protein YjjB (DUF3815 family)